MPVGVGYYPLADGHFHICTEVTMTIDEWRKKYGKCKTYAHFDKRVNVNDVWSYISNPEKVAHHGFYPFIHFKIEFNKYNETKGVIPKSRDICYSAHIDRCIYQYYSFLLNEIYNKRVFIDGINDVAVAYRNNLGKNNIDLSKCAFDFIKQFDSCYIMVGDFTSFFNKLNHKYLKKQLCNLLNTNTLTDDYYAVFKNITHYSTWDLNDLLEINGLKNDKHGRHELNSKDSVLSLKQFKDNKNQYIHPNTQPYGIPQGSPISAVLANVYMLEADKTINDYVCEHGGLYIRYSDDFIIVLPVEEQKFNKHYKWIKSFLASVEGVILSPEKTQLFKYSKESIKSCNSMFEEEILDGKNILNFLGFSFDGREVTIRDKTISKYYYRMYRKASTISDNGFISPAGNKISCRNLYDKYSVKGAKGEKGNFISYVYRANKVYNGKEPIGRSTKNHMFKIRRALNKNLEK